MPGLKLDSKFLRHAVDFAEQEEKKRIDAERALLREKLQKPSRARSPGESKRSGFDKYNLFCTAKKISPCRYESLEDFKKAYPSGFKRTVA